jgi:glucosamine-6-phosphate deaminase
MWPASALQQHPRSTLVCDEDATLDMRVRTVRYFKSIQEVHGQVVGAAAPPTA